VVKGICDDNKVEAVSVRNSRRELRPPCCVNRGERAVDEKDVAFLHGGEGGFRVRDHGDVVQQAVRLRKGNSGPLQRSGGVEAGVDGDVMGGTDAGNV
jgi:hypothetical protein